MSILHARKTKRKKPKHITPEDHHIQRQKAGEETKKGLHHSQETTGAKLISPWHNYFTFNVSGLHYLIKDRVAEFTQNLYAA